MFLALISSANANNEANTECWNANTNNSAGNANTNIGAHLMRYYYKNMQPCLLAKDNKSTKDCIGSSGEDSVCALQNMKRIGGIFEEMCSMENLHLAYLNARKGKRKSFGVIEFEKDIEGNLLKLQKDLLELKFKTSTYTNFTINEYGKERLISRLPFYPDRIEHHLLMLKLESIWCSIFIRDTYACIKKRGIHDGLRRVKKSLKDIEGTRYCLKIDIRKFYPSIDHEILKDIIRKKIKDENLLFVLFEVIDSAPGVPIGNYLSQYFANLYLAYFDHYMKEVQGVKYYHRYADDIVILRESKEYLHGLLVNISDYFQQHLKLELKHNYQIFPVEKRGVNYLGYVIFHDHVILRKSIKLRMFRVIRKMTAQNYKQKLAAYKGWLKYCHSVNLQKTIKDMIMKRFSDLGIEVEVDSLLGEKIKMSKVLGKEIIVLGYKITESKFENSKHCLILQIEIDGEKRVIFTGGLKLKMQLEQVSKEDFPFSGTIVNIDNLYQFQ